MTDSAGWTWRPLLRTDAAAGSSPTPLTPPCCLQPDHMHLNGDPVPAAADQQDGSREWEAGEDTRLWSEGTTSANSDDVSGGWTYEWSLVHSLSPELELNICDTDIQAR
ncbi:hypothetical protein EYF80_006105 [Liparis tanakae]|uniref:Uncharacterized protein n=1 Tax=Liparis tanakae TaxID=230148 RepID=A0A4Z2J0N4_9TELE|nr:hypothetical protein EYF80_006105 [Liparis tanakae]